ncbi:MAG TPA: PRC-barrel domain-containing protein [Acidimicrobiales bacterium]|nr:PRC-barrel domain-containing protein [Acidimicrobiales bacterium]
MTQLLTLTAGTEVDCVDGSCGQVDRALVDPARRVLRHLAVEGPGEETGRLVPFDRVESVAAHIKLDCSRAEYEAFESAAVAHQVPNLSGAALGGSIARTVLDHTVPAGEVEVRDGEDVRADNGRLGRLRGIVVDGDDGRIQRILVTVGHLFNKREVSLPASMVANFDDERVRLAGSKSQLMKRIPV